MKPKQLERKFTLMSEFFYCLYSLMPIIFIGPLVAAQGSPVGIIIALAMVAGTIGFLYYRRVQFDQEYEQHSAALQDVVRTHGGQLQSGAEISSLPPELENVSLLLVDNRDAKCENYLTTQVGNYIDVSYAIYRRTKNGEYKAATVYSSVLAARLPRIMPNVFFDSKTQGGRQYKSKFSRDQRHSLEGDFDTYFDTYFAEGYTIDSMSFITPDVMQAMEATADYDIEIMGDRLLLYGPVYVGAAQINDGMAKMQVILKTLQVTAAAYRDERLPGAAGMTTVTPEGLQLKRNNGVAWVSIIFVIIYLLLRIFVGLGNH